MPGTDAPRRHPLPQAVEGQTFEDRFKRLVLIGSGAMGTVWRCYDRVLDRTVAVKQLVSGSGAYAALAEARIAARLQHPNIAPVYDLGRTPSDQHWLVMREVVGQDYSALLEVAAQRPDAGNLRRLIGVLHTVCGAMAYAHGRRVVHLDIKPANIRVGDFGEVALLDWGVAGDIGDPANGAGTPGFMAPEQADGAPLDPRMDVYALGRLLHETLRGRSSPELEPLWALARRALAGDPAERPADAGEMAQAIGRWLDGADDRDAARALIAEARAMQDEIDALRTEATRLETAAGGALDTIPEHARVDDKLDAWAKEDAARAARRAAQARETDYERRLDEARRRADDVIDARLLQADLYRRQVEDAELDRDAARADASIARLKAVDVGGRHARFLAGTGSLTLHTDPPGAEVWCAPYVERRRRLEPGPERLLGRTPLVRTPLGRGSWRLRLVFPGRVDVIYPVLMPRGGLWDGVPPGESAPAVIRLPRAADLDEGERYVPAGWFWSGDPAAADGLPRRRIWLDGFVMGRDPLTYRTLQADLDTLWSIGEHDRARRIAPAMSQPALPFPGLEETPDGIRVIPADPAVSVLDWPVVNNSWRSARAWAAWRAELTGRPLRLPHDLEREKAARSVDSRTLPWGHHLEPTWANMVNSRAGRPSPLPVDRYETDMSPYGIRGLVGNVKDWCINPYRRMGLPADLQRVPTAQLYGDPNPPPSPQYMCRGGGWASKGYLCRAAARFAGPPDATGTQLGVRLVRRWPIPPPHESDPAEAGER